VKEKATWRDPALGVVRANDLNAVPYRAKAGTIIPPA
jgi:hypothetical protein